MKQRRIRKYVNWQKEIIKGNTDKFYKSTDWDILREQALSRDKYKCQFFLGNWTDGVHKADKVKLVNANTVHHIISIKERPDLALDINNLVSLSFEAHEIIEDRQRWTWRNKKIPLTEEKW